MQDSQNNITLLLQQYSTGNQQVLEQLSPLIYVELKKIAKRIFNAESSAHTLQPTALVNEAFIKLVDVQVSWQNRSHFYALAARLMRRLLVDYAKAKHASKRGGNDLNLTLNTQLQGQVDSLGETADLLALNEAIDKLAVQDARKAQLIELQYFAGLKFEEIAEVTGLSTSTIDRELRFSRAFLKSLLT